MNKRFLLSILLCISLVFSISGTAFATDTEDTNTSKITVLYDGIQIPFDVQPVIISGRTMVPFRAIFEKLGYTVDYDSETKTVSALKGTTAISMVVGSTEIHCGENIVQSDVASVIQSDRTMVPVRIIAELSNCDVLWDAYTHTALIYHKQAEDYSTVPFTYESMACDSKYIYTQAWKDGVTNSTVAISLDDFSCKYLPFQGANDYMVYNGKLYGRFGLSKRLSYGVYDPATGRAQDIFGAEIAGCYVYQGQIYYEKLTYGSDRDVLYKMNLDGTNVYKVYDGRMNCPVDLRYAIHDGHLFSGYGQSLFVLPLNTMKPTDLLLLAGIDPQTVLLNDVTLSGDFFYAAMENYYGEFRNGTSPLGILKYNYKTGEFGIIPLDYYIANLIVTDNSIYFLAPREDENYSGDLYRAAPDGSHPVLIAERVYPDAMMYGNYIYYGESAGELKTSIVRIATDGTQRKVLLTYSIPENLA